MSHKPMHITIRDIRYGIRSLLRAPGFAAVAIITIALGIAGNTAIFSAIDQQVLRTLPVPHAEELVQLLHTGQDDSFSIPVFEYLRDHNHGFKGLFASDDGRFSLLIDGKSDFVRNRFVSGNFDSLMGVAPVIGRGFTPQDDQPRATPVAVLGYGYWKQRFGASPSAVGKIVIANDLPLKIIGVYPDLSSHWKTSVWLPMVLHPALALKDNTSVGIFGRLAPGVSDNQTEAAMSVAYQQALSNAAGAVLTAEKQREISNSKINLLHIGRGGARSFSNELRILAAAVAFVLLIACANVANLLLARAMGRRREIAVRLALGATRAQLVQQLLVESLLLGISGGCIGLLLAWWGSRTPTLLESPRLAISSPNPRLLAFTVLLSLIVTLLFGLAPALQATAFGSNVTASLSAAGRLSVSGTRSRFRSSLLLAQIGLSVVCLIGAGLLLRTLMRLHQENVGFNQEHILIARIYPTLAGYHGQKETDLYWRLLERLNSTPGVSSASMSRMQLLSGYWGCNLAPKASGNSDPAPLPASCNSIAPRFFKTLGVSFLLGRDFSSADNSHSRKVAILSESAAREYFSGMSPIGQEIAFHDETFKERLLVVGVVKDIRSSLRQEQLHRSARAIYIPFAQAPAEMRGQAMLEIRTLGDPAVAMGAVRRRVESIDKALPLVEMQTQTDAVEEELEGDRSLAFLTSAFGALALTLTAIGLYGSIAYLVARRTREIGIRMALGATRIAVLSQVMREAGALVAAGLLLGFAGSIVLTRAISSQLYGVSPVDPTTFASVTVLLSAVALAAAYIPARRAMSVDPVLALRWE